MAKKDTGFEYEPFSYTTYKESNAVKQAQNALNAQLADKPSAYQSQWQTQLNEIIGKIQAKNKEGFTYDLNGDALYQQYKDKYIQQGKMAMEDAIGQASAMTGGYGNSYAQSVGQQAYHANLLNLNDIVPVLYQLALDRYNMEKQDLYNEYALLGERDNTDYGRYRDTVSDYLTERDYLANRYDSERNFDYSKYNNDRDFTYGMYADAKNYAYTDHRNAIADEQWKDEYQLALDQFDLQKAQAGASKGTTGKYVVPEAPKYLTDTEKIAEWSGAIREATSESDVLLYVERLEQVDPSLADALYEEWMEKHRKPGKVDTTVQGGGATEFRRKNGQVDMLN